MALRKDKQRFLRGLPGIGENPRKTLLQGAVILLLVITAFAHLKTAFLAQLAMNRGPQLANFSQALTDPDALASLARNEHLANGNLTQALTLYRRSLANFVLHVPSWLGIVELFNDMGEREKAAVTLRTLHGFSANSEDSAWTKALLAHELDQEDILAESLSWLVANHPGKLQEVLTLADLRWQDTATIMAHFGSSQYQNLLDHYIRTREPAKAATVWLGIEQAGGPTPELALRYVNFLLQQDEISQAAGIWRKYFQQDSTLLYDGTFQQPFADSGFSWRITRGKGVVWEKLSDRSGLQITFDGTENIAFRLSQLIPLAPGQYLFKGLLGTRDLTTDQRPFWSITGYKCEGLAINDSMLPPTTEHREFVLPFAVPDSCQAVQMALQRSTSYFFDNKLAGTITLEGLSIEPLTAGAIPGQQKALPTEAPPSGNTELRINKMKIR